jgi:hypothetical protein
MESSLFDHVIMTHNLCSPLRPSNCTAKVVLGIAAKTARHIHHRVGCPPCRAAEAAPVEGFVIQMPVRIFE